MKWYCNAVYFYFLPSALYGLLSLLFVATGWCAVTNLCFVSVSGFLHIFSCLCSPIWIEEVRVKGRAIMGYAQLVIGPAGSGKVNYLKFPPHPLFFCTYNIWEVYLVYLTTAGRHFTDLGSRDCTKELSVDVLWGLDFICYCDWLPQLLCSPFNLVSTLNISNLRYFFIKIFCKHKSTNLSDAWKIQRDKHIVK